MSLTRIALEFRDGLLGGARADRMCYAVCAPLQGYLSACCGVQTVLEEVDFGFSNHVWLRLADGRILDPTADQFPDAALPSVYLGPVPAIYRQWMSARGGRA